jgi:3-deoxy-7-phosphoheptulonate synthase
MVFLLHSNVTIPMARERLISLGLDHQVLPSGNISLQSELSILRPKQIQEKLSDLGTLEGSHTKTPLLDAMEGQHSVRVHVTGRSQPIIFSNFSTPVWIAGPCSLDPSNNLKDSAKKLSDAGVQVLRGGAVKPRTSPHEFQGMGREGYRLLSETAREFGLAALSETLSEDDIPEAVEFLDIIQIGARNMQNFALLRKLGKSGKPVLLKRNAGANLKEWASAAEYLLAEGNQNVILCERGVRGLERELRYTLDLAGAAFMQHRYGLPVIIDPSHATGTKQILEACTAGALAMGFAGVMLETHPKPSEARSDALQALTTDSFLALAKKYKK